MVLNIIGWIIIVWLTLSTAYSTWYHFKNYFSSKDNEVIIAHDLDSRGEIKEMNKKDFVYSVIRKQFYKIVIIGLLLYFVLS